MTDTQKLQEAINRSGVKKQAICDRCGMTYATLRTRISGETEFTAREIYILAQILSLTDEQRDSIFFAESVN